MQVTKDIQTIAQVINDPHFGCKVINLIQLENIPLYKTLSHNKMILDQKGEGLPLNVLITLISRYFSVITEVVNLDIHYHEGSVEIILKSNLPGIVTHHQVEGVAVGIYRIIDSLSSSKLIELNFEHTTANQYNYKDIFSIAPKFSEGINRLLFSCTDAVESMDSNSLYTLGTLQQLLDHQFPNVPDDIRCQHIIQSILSFGEPTRENVADILNISVSTLQRKLRLLNTNFKALLLETRKSTAHDLLINHNRSPSDLAFLLGYQSRSQFFKAFKTWFSMTPSEYKNKPKNIPSHIKRGGR